MANEIVVEMKMPDVKSDKDVELNRLSDSIEVRGYGQEKGYFKILNIPRKHTLLEKKLDEGKLVLKFNI